MSVRSETLVPASQPYRGWYRPLRCGSRSALISGVIISLTGLWVPLSLLAQDRSIEVGEIHQLGKIQHLMIDESSGLTPSVRYPHCYWTHNDNGPYPGLFLVDAAGRLKGKVELPSISFRDWEDLASFSLQGKNYLLLADVGDNLARYRSGRLYLFPEPEFDTDLSEKKRPVIQLDSDISKIEFTYPDGPRDCEAVLVDAEKRKVFLVSKTIDKGEEQEPSKIYSVPLVLSTNSRPVVAEEVTSPFQKPLITGAQISPDQRLAAIRSYSTAWIFRRTEGESWENVFRRGQPEKRVVLPLQRQGEAICFTPNSRSLLITSEGVEQRIWQIELKFPQNDR